MTQDFGTMAIKQETSIAAVGADTIARGRADCNIDNVTLRVPLFANEDDVRFNEYAGRLRVRGGFTAISATACKKSPAACSAVQRVLEKQPTLSFDLSTGRLRHAYSIQQPRPPPPPLPPPRLIQYGLKSPPPPNPPPAPPPYFAASAEPCVPIVTSAESGVDIGDAEDRAVCLYVRAVVDQRLEAARCFRLNPSPPPPPSPSRAAIAAMQHAQRKKRVDNGLGTSNEGGAPSPTEEEEYAAQQDTSHNSHVALLDRLISQNNFGMRGVLLRIKQKISM